MWLDYSKSLSQMQCIYKICKNCSHGISCCTVVFVYIWGEPERAPHVRVVQRACLYIYIYIYINIISSDLGHGANLCRVLNGQDGHPLRSRCVRLKYLARIASNGKEIVRNETDTPTSPSGKDTGIGRRNHAN